MITLALVSIVRISVLAGSPASFTASLPVAEGTGVELVRPEVLAARLAPVTPMEADFEEALPEFTISILQLVPSTPDVAEFGDAAGTEPEPALLAPATPGTADFEE